MKPAEVLESLHNIFGKAKLLDCISIGYDKNESADIMWFSCNGKEDYLAVYDKPILPFSCIDGITYKYKKESDNKTIDFKNTNDQCILTFHLKYNCLFRIECDEDCVLNLYFNNSPDDNSKWTDNMNDLKSAVSKYTLFIEKQDVYETLIYSLFGIFENERLDTELCEKQHRIIFDYINKNTNDNDTLFLYAYEAANFNSCNYKGYPYFEEIISEVKKRGLYDELLVYVKNRCLEYNYSDDAYDDQYDFYSTFQDITERIIVQMNTDNANLESH